MRDPTIAAAIVATTVLLGCNRASNEFAPPPPPTVTVQAPARENVTTYDEFTGRLEARDTVELRARVKGFLRSVNLNPSESQLVKKGQVLFVIEQEPFEAAVESAQARVDRANAERDLAQTMLERAKQAFDKAALTQSELDQRKAELDVKAAAVKSADSALVQATLELDYTTIQSPVDGRASRELVDVGNLVGSGENTHLTTVVVDHPIYAYFNVSERRLLDYIEKRPAADERGQREKTRVNMRLADGTAYEHLGEVDYADNRVDPRTGNLQVRAVFPNEDGQLYPGLFCRVLLPVAIEDATLVPELAIQRDIVGPYLLVVDEQNTVRRTEVELGPLVGRRRVIKTGLDGSERIVINGLQRARDGVVVNPAVEETPASDA